MSAPNLDSAGLHIQSLSDIQAELATAIKTGLNAPDLLTSDPTSPEGVLVGILSDRESNIQALLASAYLMFYPDTSIGVSRQRLARLLGLQAKQASFASVTLTLSFSGPCTVPAGSIVAVAQSDGQGARFDILAQVVYAGPGAGTVQNVTAQAEQAGSAIAPQAGAGLVTTIVTAVANWTSVTNPAKATGGVDAETDAALLQRMIASYSLPGQSPTDAIRAQALVLVGISQCIVNENTTLVVDANGVDAKSINCIVWPDPGIGSALETSLAAVIWKGTAGGIEASGNSSSSRSVNTTDLQGHTQTVKYSVAVAQAWACTVVCTPAATATEKAAIIAAIEALGAKQLIGQAVSFLAVASAVVVAAPGKTTYGVYIATGGAPPPATAGTADEDLAMTALQIATISAAGVLAPTDISVS